MSNESKGVADNFNYGVNYLEENEPIHLWFELSYAQYLTVPRSIMEAMPVEWQRKMATLLDELDETWFDGKPFNGKTVGTYFGNHGAAIAALAEILKSVIEENLPKIKQY